MSELAVNVTTKKLTPYIIAFALFIETLDITIISTAIPKIAHSLTVDVLDLKLALTSYLLSLAVFIPISGWIADKYGTKKVFAAAIAIFTLASILCGMANSLAMLIVARIIQGFGGALMMPVGRLILLKTYATSELLAVTNLVTIPSLLGPVLGPLLGGIIVNYVSWRWIFFVNLPFGIAGLILTLKYIGDFKETQISTLDKTGFILFGITLLTLSCGFTAIGEGTLSTNNIIALLVISLISATSYFIYSSKRLNPLIDLAVFKIRTFRVTVLGSLFSRLGIGGIPFLLPLLFQAGLGLSPLYSGLLIVPLAIAMLLMKFYVKPLVNLFGFKKLLLMNTALLGISIMPFGLINSSTSYYLIVIMVFIHGLLTSIQFSCMNVLSYVDLDQAKKSKGTSIASTVQQLAMSFGVAVSALFLKLFINPALPFNNQNLMAFHKTFLVIGLITVLASLSFSRLQANDGHKASY